MSRSARARSGLGFDLDWGELHRVTSAMRGTQQQAEMAYRRAMKRTQQTIGARVKRLMMAGLRLKDRALLERRIRQFRLSTKGSYLPGFKIWFGLNQIKAKDLRGRVRYSPLPHHTQRDPATGRYVAASGRVAIPPSFAPLGPMLKSRDWVYPGGVVRKGSDGDLRIFVPGNGRLADAEVDVYDAMMVVIEDDVFGDAVDIFMHHFRTDLRGRVKGGITGNRGR